MRWQSVVSMLFDSMMMLARLFLRIDMNDDEREVFEMVQQLVPHLFGNRMSGGERDLRGERDIYFRV